jgi:hypothetical protein
MAESFTFIRLAPAGKNWSLLTTPLPPDSLSGMG